MTEEEIRKRLAAIDPETWRGAEAIEVEGQNGDTIVRLAKARHRGVRLKPDGSWFEFGGALGKLSLGGLGLPTSHERVLGSVRQGRYQVFEGGLGVWEDHNGLGDIGFPIQEWQSRERPARTCNAMIAFFDLRGFTEWAGKEEREPATIQREIEAFEDAFQEPFVQFPELFAKSTGDGFMVVSLAEWFQPGEVEVQSGHATAFCRACASTVQNAIGLLSPELAIGCGVTTGQVTQLHLLGRLDYLGPAINKASKIQSVAYNELIVSQDVLSFLEADGAKIVAKSKLLPGKGFRVSIDSILSIVTVKAEA